MADQSCSFCVFVRSCPGLNKTFPAAELDSVPAAELPVASDQLAQRWLDEHPAAEVEYQKRIVARLKEASERFISRLEAPQHDELAEVTHGLRRQLGTDPDMPLFLRVARMASWGTPERQAFLGGQPVSVRFVVSREPDEDSAKATVAILGRQFRHELQDLGPHFGYCSEGEIGVEESRESAIVLDNRGHPLSPVIRKIADYIAKPDAKAGAGAVDEKDLVENVVPRHPGMETTDATPTTPAGAGDDGGTGEGGVEDPQGLPEAVDLTILSIEKWSDLGIGIDAGAYLAVTPCPDFGKVFPKQSAEQLDLPRGQWDKLLDRLARSETGKTASKGTVMEDFGYFTKRVSTTHRDLEELQQDGHVMQQLKTAKRKLTDAMSNLTRRLREQIEVCKPKDPRCLSVANEGIVESGFTVRHLVREGDGKLHFGDRNLSRNG